MVEELEAAYPLRKFTPDGHLAFSIGEVIAAEALSFRLHPASYPGHDAYDDNGNVQIKNQDEWRASRSLSIRLFEL